MSDPTRDSAEARAHLDLQNEAVSVPRLLGGCPVELPGYPLPMVQAEKIVTALGEAL